jgi:hypothetical protein
MSAVSRSRRKKQQRSKKDGSRQQQQNSPVSANKDKDGQRKQYESPMNSPFLAGPGHGGSYWWNEGVDERERQLRETAVQAGLRKQEVQYRHVFSAVRPPQFQSFQHWMASTGTSRDQPPAWTGEQKESADKALVGSALFVDLSGSFALLFECIECNNYQLLLCYGYNRNS